MTALSIFGSWWTATMLPWAIDSTIVGLVLLAVGCLQQQTTPAFRKAVATIGLAKLVTPPLLLPIGLLSLGVTDPTGSSLEPLGAPLAGSAMGVLGGLHVLGVAVGAAMLTRRVWHLNRLRATATRIVDPAARKAVAEVTAAVGLRRAPGVLESNFADVPFVTGLVQSVVILPSDLIAKSTDAQLRGLLAHEFLHLRNLDLWLGWLRAIALTVWWPSPVARALGSIQEAAAEELCDDLVLGRGLSSASDYARGLVTAAASSCQRHRGPVAAAVGTSELEHRIRRFDSPSRARLTGPSAFTLVLLVLLLLPPISSGQISSGGWTTRFLFTHGTPVGSLHEPASSQSSHRTHRADH